MNRITLYSNGTGVFERAYTLTEGAPLRLSLPIRNDSLDEVVASIGVFGDVTLTEPPSYTPIGVGATNLEIDADNVVRDLATRLRGAQVSVRVAAETVVGRLAGVQGYQETVGETVVDRYRLALFDETGALRTLADREIVSLKFVEAGVQAEIDKVLQRAFETIKPNSTFVNLTLVPNSEAETQAVVQYAVAQLGAWKISYRLRGHGDDWTLEGQAVVDNSTEEPWEDCLISVITGEPISFSTDLAEIRVVRRSRVNIVSDQALGSVDAAEGLEDERSEGLALDAGRGGGFAGSAPVMYSRLLASPASVSRPDPIGTLREGMAGEYGGAGRARAKMAHANQQEAMTKAVGDDTVEYTSPYPVSIGANRSAIIPLFTANLKTPVRLLIYKPAEHATRPFRALRFHNETEQSLGRGVCTLFEEGVYVGKSIVESTKPGEERTLVYALETGVRVIKETDNEEYNRLQVHIERGVGTEKSVNRMRTRYRIQNNRSIGSSFEIEHIRESQQSKFTATVTQERMATIVDIPAGIRIALDLPAKDALTVTVVETELLEYSIDLDGSNGVGWLEDNILTTTNPLDKNPAIQICIERQANVNSIKRELADVELQIKDILEEQERLKGLLQAGGHEGAANEWRTTLAQNERTIKELKTTRIPALRERIKEAETALQEALEALTLTIED